MDDNEFYFKALVVLLCFLLLGIIVTGYFVADAIKQFEKYQSKEIVKKYSFAEVLWKLQIA